MGRPPLAPGTAGDIWCDPLPDGQVEARCNFRDYDGKTRQIRRRGATETAAKRALRAAIRDRQDSVGAVGNTTKVAALAELYLEQVDASDKAIGTKQHYHNVVRLYVNPAMGALNLGEVTTASADRALAAVSQRAGAGAAKSMRSVLSGMFRLAVRHEAIRTNPVRETTPISRGRKDRVRALTVGETEHVTGWLHDSDRAKALDLPDLVDAMLGTGCRIGEACAMREGLNAERRQLLDIRDVDAGVWEVNATVIRVMGVKRLQALEAKATALGWAEAEELKALRTLPPGLHIQERTKSDAGWRVLALPPSMVAMLQRRQNMVVRWEHPSGVIFTSPKARALRDPSNTPGDLRRVLDAIDCPKCGGTALIPDKSRPGRFMPCDSAGPFGWVTSHVFRKTVATRMDEAGCSAREIADQLGHAQPSMTQNVYMGRNVVSSAAAQVLDRPLAA